MKMRILLFSAAVAIGVAIPGVIVSAAGNEDQFNVSVYAVLGPLVNTNNPAYQAWSTNEVAMLYHNQTLADDLGYRLVAEDLAQQSPALTNNTLWFPARVTGKNGSKVSLAQLQFSEWSSDGNSLANSYILASVSGLVYGPHAYGVNWGTNGPGSNTILPDGTSGTNMVDEIDFIGMESTYYQYPLTTVSNYFRSFSNFLLTASCTVVSNGTVLARGQKTLETVGSPAQPLLSIQNAGGDTVIVSISNLATNRTAVVRSTTDLNKPFTNWQLEASVNSGDTLVRVRTNQPAAYFRAQLE